MSDPNAREQMAHWMSDMYKSNPEMDIGAEDIPYFVNLLGETHRAATPLNHWIEIFISDSLTKTNPLMVSTFKRPIYSPATLSVKKNVFCFFINFFTSAIRHDATGKRRGFLREIVSAPCFR